jgi:hypothetical protein
MRTGALEWATSGSRPEEFYFRAPRRGCFNFDCRLFADLRFGLLMIKVPLPMYSALYNLSSAM